jgi:DNA (cytosine-5)-methyltransferase 1
MSKLKALDFFCGGGGMTYGLKQSGIDVIAGIDFDIECKETYEINNPDSTFIHADITKLPTNYFEDFFSLNINDDNLIMVGCSPCQYYSLINTSKEKSKKSKDLLLDFKRFIKYYRPGYIIVENVPGILSKQDSVLPKFISFLRRNNYRYIEYAIEDLSYHGVPQSRKRFSLIASRLNQVKLPIKDASKALLKDFIGVHNNYPKINAGHKDNSIFNHTCAGLNPLSLARLKKNA